MSGLFSREPVISVATEEAMQVSSAAFWPHKKEAPHSMLTRSCYPTLVN